MELRIKPYLQKNNLEALFNFELNLINKNKLRSIIKLRIKPYS